MSTANELRLSILEFVHIYNGTTATESLQNMTEMVQLAEQWGSTDQLTLEQFE